MRVRVTGVIERGDRAARLRAVDLATSRQVEFHIAGPGTSEVLDTFDAVGAFAVSLPDGLAPEVTIAGLDWRLPDGRSR